MDFNSLKDTVSNLTLYDVKHGVRKVQNAVMNFTEMEAKVREATNNEPWGASSTLMQEIANGTFSYQTLNEIMPMIYRRFTEKSAEEWRQIYKALQLLEFLIKHGSERVIDDARSHLTLLKMLRQFHFIDQNGKDQGINVRNRAKELSELLGDVDRIRSERKKARANRVKYTGVEGGATFGGGFSARNSRYGGFGSETGGHSDYGGFSGGVYGDGGGFGGQSDDWRGESSSSSRRDRFEEYDEFDEHDRPAAVSPVSRSTHERAGVKKTTEAPKKKEPEIDLFSFDEPAAPSVPAAAPALSSGSNLAVLNTETPHNNNDDDEFDDFQSAAPGQSTAQASLGSPTSPVATATASSAQFAAPQPISAPQQANLNGMVGTSSISPTSSTFHNNSGPVYSAFSSPMTTGNTAMSPAALQPSTTGYQAAQPNYFQSVQGSHAQPTSGAGMQAGTPSDMKGANKPAASASKSAAGGGDAFGALWSQASAGIKKTSTPSTPGPAMGQLAKEKSSAGIWGPPGGGQSMVPKPSANNQPPTGSASDDLLG